MESLDRVKILHPFIGNIISDHRVVGIGLEIRKQLENHQSTRHKNYKEFNLNSFMQVFSNNRIVKQSSIYDAVQVFIEEMERTLDIIATLEGKKKPKRRKQAMVY